VSASAVWATPAVKVLFRILWGDGVTTAEMARRLSTDEFPLTKNMIVNQARTLRLTGRPCPVRRQSEPSSHPRAVRERAQNRGRMQSQPLASESPASAGAFFPLVEGHTLPPLASESPVASAPTPPRPWPPLVDKPVAAAPRRVIAAPVPVVRPPPAWTPRPVKCAWPIGGGRSIRWCDEQTVPGMPYCEGHCAKAYETKGWRQRVEGNSATMGGDD
jgi:hypothetical protein